MQNSWTYGSSYLLSHFRRRCYLGTFGNYYLKPLLVWAHDISCRFTISFPVRCKSWKIPTITANLPPSQPTSPPPPPLPPPPPPLPIAWMLDYRPSRTFPNISNLRMDYYQSSITLRQLMSTEWLLFLQPPAFFKPVIPVTSERLWPWYYSFFGNK